MTGTVRVESDDRGVATITLARPEVKNAFDAALIADLRAALLRLDPRARCVILRGEGDTFCAGADLNWMREAVDYSTEQNLADARALVAMLAELDELPMPLLARVQGAALGGGCGLVAIQDIAVASRETIFGFTEVRLGIVPAAISPYVVRKIGVANATAAFVTGVRFDAKRAHEMGLVQSVGAPEDADHTIEHFVEAILASGPTAVRAAKRLAREVAGRSVADVRELTAQRMAAMRLSEEGQEGMHAFLDRRKPRWHA